MLPPVMLPVAVINPLVPILPMFALPLTDNDVSVPTLVMFACAASLTVFATPDVAAFKLATRVVLVTVNGAVPVAMLETNVGAITCVVAFKFAPTMLPDVTVSVVVFLSKVNDAEPLLTFWSLN